MLENALALANLEGCVEPSDRFLRASEFHPVAGEVVGEGGHAGMVGEDLHDRVDRLDGAVEPEEGVAAVHVAAEIVWEQSDLSQRDLQPLTIELTSGEDLEADFEDLGSVEVFGADLAQFGLGLLDITEFQPPAGELEVHAVGMRWDAFDHRCGELAGLDGGGQQLARGTMGDWKTPFAAAGFTAWLAEHVRSTVVVPRSAGNP